MCIFDWSEIKILKMQSINNFNQQEEEKLVLELFRQEYDLFPKGKVVKSESPDFILKNTIKVSTGIELTKLHGRISKNSRPTFRKGTQLIFYQSHLLKI